MPTLESFFAYVVWRGAEPRIFFREQDATAEIRAMHQAGWKDAYGQFISGTFLGEVPPDFPYPLSKQDTTGYSVWCRTNEGVWYEADRNLSTAAAAQQEADLLNRTGRHLRGRTVRMVGLAVPMILTRSRMELEPKTLG